MTISYKDLKDKRYLEQTKEFVAQLLDIRFIDDSRAYCPFHDDRNDSFRVYVNRNDEVRFRCFGQCDSDWDVYDLIMRITGCRFTEAQLMFAEALNTKIILYKDRAQQEPEPIQEPQEPVVEAASREMTDEHRKIMQSAAEFYRDLLLSNQDKYAKVIQFLTRRGLPEDELVRFNIGYCPALEDEEYQGRALINHLRPLFEEDNRRLRNHLDCSVVRLLYDETHKAFSYYSQFIRFGEGIIGRYADYFSGRITFPVYDLDGRIVGILGRRPNNRGVRWMKQSQEDTVIRSKGWLYGIDKAARWISQYETVILVEGIFDYFAFYNVFENKDRPIVVSSLGARIDQASLDLLIALGAKNFIIAFDADNAGRRGIHDAVGRLDMATVSYLGSLKEGEDPVDHLKGVLGQISNFAIRHLQKGMAVESPSGKPVMASLLTTRQKGRQVISEEILIKPVKALPPPGPEKSKQDNTCWYKKDDLLPLLSYNHSNRAELERTLDQIRLLLDNPLPDQPDDSKDHFRLPRQFMAEGIHIELGASLILHLRLALEQQSRRRRIKETDATIAEWLNTSRRTVIKYKDQLKEAGLLKIEISGIQQSISVKYFPRYPMPVAQDR